ncbi:MAG: Nif3-like dinuclear metal center hexameric protein [Bacteroidales bacterium]
MTKVKDITSLIEKYAPKAFAEEWDNPGLQIGDKNQEVTKILISLDFTEEVLNEAISKNCNLIINHHPFIFRGIKNITTNNSDSKLIINAIKNNISIYAAHTNLDNINDGLNWLVAKRIGLSNIEPLDNSNTTTYKLVIFTPKDHVIKVRNALFDAGAGSIGNYDCCSYNSDGYGTFRANENTNPYVGEIGKIHEEPEIRTEVIVSQDNLEKVTNAIINVHPYEEPAYFINTLNNKHKLVGSGIIGTLEKDYTEDNFLKLIKDIVKTPTLRHTIKTGKKIKKVALCTGSGSFLINKALSKKADAFVTADLKYHDFYTPNKQLLLIDAGHFETEIFSCEWFKNIISKNYSNIEIIVSETFTNPVNYYSK